MKLILMLVQITLLVALVLSSPATAICANSTWISCADAVQASFETARTTFEGSGMTPQDVDDFYCNATVTYYQAFAACTSALDCWRFPSAVELRRTRYNISDCTSVNVSTILGGAAASCPEMSCDELLPGLIAATLAPKSSSYSLTSGATLAALSLLALSLLR